MKGSGTASVTILSPARITFSRSGLKLPHKSDASEGSVLNSCRKPRLSVNDGVTFQSS